MKKFEVGKIYTNNEGIEIKVVRRTEKQITFIYTTRNWWEQDIEKQYKKKIQTFNKNYEEIHLAPHWSAPSITAA